MTFLPRISTTAFFTLCLIILMVSSAALLKDPDTLWHIAAGDLIRTTHAVPHIDPWSFTAGANEWFLLSWLWDAGISFSYQHGEWFGVALFTALQCAFMLALLFSASRARCRDITAAFLTMILAFAGLSLLARPQIVTLVMVILYARILYRFHAGTCSSRALIALPLLMIVWVNCHGGFLAGFTVLGAYGLQSIITQNRRAFLTLLAASIATALATLANPYGIHVYEGAMRSLGGALNAIIQEWQPLRMSPSTLMSYPMLIAFIALIPFRHAQFSLAERILAYLWFALALSSIRHMAVFIVLVTPMVAFALDHIILRGEQKPGWPPLVRLTQRLGRYKDHAPARAGLLLAPLLVLAVLFTPWGKPDIAADFLSRLRLEREIAYIEHHYPKARLLIHYNFASAFIFETRGRIPVFIDSRADTVYPPTVAKDYVAFAKDTPGWEDRLKPYGLTGALIPPAALAPALYRRFSENPAWKKAYETDNAALFLRRK